MTTSIGVLCLDTSFTKIPGHIRNPATFDFPVVYRVVRGATPERVVKRADNALLGPFIRAARDLEARGVAAITGACGFLVLFQQELADSVRIPLYTSSLIQLPMVARMISSDRRVGLLVARQESLTRDHLAAIGGESVRVGVAGMTGRPEFTEVILEGRRDELDVGRLRGEVLATAVRLTRDYPDLGAIIMECTDMVPFARDIQEATKLPVFDIVTLTTMVHQSLTRISYA